jgi:hypothetical protein
MRGRVRRVERVDPFDVEGLDVGDVSGGEDQAVDVGGGGRTGVQNYVCRIL